MTEDGPAPMQGKTTSEWARPLIDIAHSGFRGELEAAVRELALL